MSNVYVISPNNAKLVSLSEEELVLGTPKLCFGMCLPRFEATLNSAGIQMVVEVNAYINLNLWRRFFGSTSLLKMLYKTWMVCA